jgi:methionyl aminopeptidase
MTRLRARDACWCGSGKRFDDCHGDWTQARRTPQTPGTVGGSRSVPKSIQRPPYALGRRLPSFAGPEIVSGGMRKRLRHAGRVAADVLLAVGARVQPGVTTDELDAVAHEAYVSRGAYPSTLTYRGYPRSICTSVNEVICHGIPDDHVLNAGDIVSVDVTAYVDGVHGDTCATFYVGDVDEPTRGLVEGTRIATLAGIAAVAAGRPLEVIGQAVQGVADGRGLGVVEDYGGHGRPVPRRTAHQPPPRGAGFGLAAAGEPDHHDRADGHRGHRSASRMGQRLDRGDRRPPPLRPVRAHRDRGRGRTRDHNREPGRPERGRPARLTSPHAFIPPRPIAGSRQSGLGLMIRRWK